MKVILMSLLRTCALVLCFCFCFTCVVSAPSLAAVTVNQRAIDELKAGKTKVAHASWWGFDPEDATAALQTAISSGAKKVIVEKMSSPWIVKPIQLASDQEIVFQQGVVILAKKGEFKSRTASLLNASLKQNIRLTGPGAVLQMRKADYDAAPYEKAEWRNGLSLRSCSNVVITGLTIKETGGDGIYLGVAKRGVPNRKITIRNVIFEQNYRQGVSVISAEDLLIEDSVFKETSGTPPMAGIDFEPNHPSECLINCVLRNCVAENNQGGGYLLYLPNLNRDSKPISIRFENCTSTGKRRALSLTTGNKSPGSVTGSIEFVNCTFASTEQIPVIIQDKPADVCPVLFKACTISGPATDDTAIPAIRFAARAGAVGKIGGVTFEQCIVKSPVKRPVMSFHDASYLSAVAKIKGTLRVEQGKQMEDLTLNPALIARWMPSSPAGDITPYKTDVEKLEPLDVSVPFQPGERRSVRQRKLSHYLLYAKQGDQVAVQLSYQKLGRYTGDKMHVKVVAPSGKTIPVASVPFQESATCEFKAPETGVYQLNCDPGPNYMRVDASSHRLCLASDGAPIRLMASTGDYYFYVPAGVEKWAVGVFGEGAGERVSAKLYNPSGKQVWSEQNVAKPTLFTRTRPQNSPGELWRLVLSRPTQGGFEDHYVQLVGIPAVLALTPGEMLVPESQE
jgi:hypothetical protein